MMTVRAYTVTLWLATVATAPGLALLAYAALYAGRPAAVVVSATPAAFTGMVAAISWLARREARTERDTAELAAANDRENNISR